MNFIFKFNFLVAINLCPLVINLILVPNYLPFPGKYETEDLWMILKQVYNVTVFCVYIEYTNNSSREKVCCSFQVTFKCNGCEIKL